MAKLFCLDDNKTYCPFEMIKLKKLAKKMLFARFSTTLLGNKFSLNIKA